MMGAGAGAIERASRWGRRALGEVAGFIVAVTVCAFVFWLIEPLGPGGITELLWGATRVVIVLTLVGSMITLWERRRGRPLGEPEPPEPEPPELSRPGLVLALLVLVGLSLLAYRFWI